MMTQSSLDEKTFQEDIIKYLQVHNGFRRGFDRDFNRATAIHAKDLVAYIRDTQPNVWAFFEQKYIDPEGELAELVARERVSKGTLHILQKGIERDGSRPEITLFYSNPKSTKNPNAQLLFDKNIFTVIDEVHYEVRDNPTRRIDLVLFINGIAISGIELKNEMTGQAMEHAKVQWITTRDTHFPLLTPTSGCLIYYAVGNAEAAFTTKLEGGATEFSYFNRGNNNGSGNPDGPEDSDENGYRTFYLWEQIWTKESLSDLITLFAHIDNPSEIKLAKQITVFPRYHQLDLINKVRTDLLANQAPYKRGSSFLIQHSAGSGKTKSIVWLSFLLNSLHDAEDNSLFDSIIVITDRKVVDVQLREALDGQSKTKGLVGIVDDNSKTLAKYIKENKRIIVTTIQKFSYIEDILKDLKRDVNRKYAIVIDEAHSGQTGEHALKVRESLAPLTLVDHLSESGALVGADNMTFFAFTATPKDGTVQRFCPDGKIYHVYSMKQAIEENCILDVLKNYASHEIINKINYTGENETLESTHGAKRALNTYIRASEENLNYKVDVVLKHMVDNTINKIAGNGKGMVVAGSRMEVYQWFKLVEKKIAENPEYSKIKPLAAFTGSLDIKEIDEVITDKNLNGFEDTQVPRKFDADYNLLIVAKKFQVGFNQPKLCSMYLDQSVSDVTAVQTLSRLNRTMVGKNDVCIIDFRDNAEAVKEAFAKYHVESELDGSRLVTEDDLISTARQVYSYSIFTEVNASDYSRALQVLKSDSDNTSAKKQAREIILAIADRIANLHDSDRAHLDLFKSISREYLSDYVFLGQFKRIGNQQLRDLRTLLTDSLKQVSRPHVQDNDWLEYIEIELTTAIVNHDAIGDVPTSEVPTPPKDTQSPRPAGMPLDHPIAIAELVAQWNARLVAELPKKKGKVKQVVPVEGSEESGLENESSYKPVFLALAARIESAPTELLNYAVGKSFDRFNDRTARGFVHNFVINSLTNMLRESKKAGTDNTDVTQVLTSYSKDSSAFKDKLVNMIIACIYQHVTNKQLQDYMLV